MSQKDVLPQGQPSCRQAEWNCLQGAVCISAERSQQYSHDGNRDVLYRASELPDWNKNQAGLKGLGPGRAVDRCQV